MPTAIATTLLKKGSKNMLLKVTLSVLLALTSSTRAVVLIVWLALEGVGRATRGVGITISLQVGAQCMIFGNFN